jgi:LysM repeat protein
MHDELLEMLSIVEVTQKMRHAPVPRPSAAKRAAAKRQFLATAAQMRQEHQAQHAPPPLSAATTTTRTLSRPAARRAARRAMNPWERFMAGLQDIFGSRSLRLAPLVLTLALLLLSTSTLVSLAQEAVPGDTIYTLKQTMRQWELALTPPSQRELVRQEQERELAEDVAKAANRADANSSITQEQDTQIYYARSGNLFKIGGLKVINQYQPDANVEIFKPMTIEGDLQPGARVNVTYQILPGQPDTVQGIALVVVEAASETEVLEVDVPTPEVQLQEAATCTVTQPEGWMPYTVVSGDNLTFLAQRSGTSIEQLAEVNCLDSYDIWIGAELYVPSDTLQTGVPVVQCGSDIPEGWERYTIQAGDMVSRLAENRGASLSDVLAVNCIESMEAANLIREGDELYLPAVE